jgi:Dolichyl-phosphate-mannose-protein mannosyltransferase
MANKYLQNKNLPFWLFTFSVALILTVSKLIQDGMFLDGMLYTCVSHNLAIGTGTFWSPESSPSFFNSGSQIFHEHPPLVFGIQSLFFRILGDSMYVERFYTFLTMCISAFLIKLLWDSIFNNDQNLKSISWLPVFLWITIPSSSWSYSNNMMENTMGIFTLSAVLFIYKSIESGKNKIGTLLLSGLFVFFATMSKGVPGFFPVVFPIIYWAIYRKKTTLFLTLFQTLTIISVPALLYFILFHLPESRENLTFYITKRLLGRINEDPTVGNRFYIIKRLFAELLPQILFSVLIISLAKLKKPDQPLISNKSLSAVFFLTGLAASVPLSFTMVQRGFYLVPSFPYFALGFSILLAPIVLNFRETIFIKTENLKIYSILSTVLFVFAICFSLMQKGKTVRDKDILHDVYVIGNTIPKKSAVTVSREIAGTYVLECYFIRYYSISLYTDEPKGYLMVKKADKPDIPPDFEKLNIETKVYDIYKREKGHPEQKNQPNI